MNTEYTTLRAELKQWEKKYQAERGRKPTPDDIKLVPGLSEKYKRFKALSKAPGQAGDGGKAQAYATARPSNTIIKHSRATEDTGDAIPAAARPNPFSPVKKQGVTTSAVNLASRPRTPETPSFPNLFASPTKNKRGGEATFSGPSGPVDSISHSPPASPNPFIVRKLPITGSLVHPPLESSKGPDSPFTAARKRIRGDGEEEIGNTMGMDGQDNTKRRKFVSRSQSSSYSGLFGAPSSYILPDTLIPSAPNTQPSQSGSSRVGEEAFQDSPVRQSVRNGVIYQPIFDDDDHGSLRAPSTLPVQPRTGTARTTSLPASLAIFSKRIEGGDTTRRNIVSSQPNLTENDDSLLKEDRAMDEDEPLNSTQLIAPTPVKTGAKQWKFQGKGKGKKLKGTTHANEDQSDEEEISDGVQAVEIKWRILGPLHAPREMDDKDDGDDDSDDNFQLLPLAKPWVRHYTSEEEDGEMGEDAQERVEIDLPEEMQELLELSPSKPRVDKNQVVEDLLAGNGDRSKRQEVWHAGDIGGEDDEWDSEGQGWWEAEL